jgi:uroporphyrinogen III methyltransferase/synthase
MNTKRSKKLGKVYLVGAGPGDPGLITVKGLKCLRKADVVVYDRLVDETILREAHKNAEKIYVGKAANHHTLDQEAINRLLVEKAREGKKVVRLKGGDPFVLGRGGEEAEALAANKILFEVVPGVSSAISVPAYAGIPVTHRGVASSFTVVTGHKASSKGVASIAWNKLATGSDTLVILMGIGNLENVVDQLVRNGRPSSTPVAVITQGTTHRQRCVIGTLHNIIGKVRSERLEPPSVIVVGDVVRFRESLSWYDQNPCSKSEKKRKRE